MNKMVKMSVVAVFLVAAVGNSVATPRQESPGCSPAESQALQVGVGEWAAEVLAESSSTLAAAEGVISACDGDGDGSLSAAEFVTCIKLQVDDSSISDECFNFMKAAGDSDSDGSVGVAELTQLFNMASASTRSLRRSARTSTGRQNLGAGCSDQDSAVLQSGVSTWLNAFASQGMAATNIASEVKRICDLNLDSSLTADEFVGCLKFELASFGIRDGCYDALLQVVDQAGDQIIDEKELLTLVNMVGGN